MMIYVILFIIGAIIGSFLNVCIHRLPREESIVWPASYCPHCQAKIRLYDNIPILSYLILRGKCRRCKKNISFRYPLVEFLTGTSFVLPVLKFGLGGEAISFSLFFAVLIPLAFIDLEHGLIPDVLTHAGIILGLVVNTLQNNLYPAFAGLLAGWVFMLFLARLTAKIYKKEAVGEGDIKLAAMLGAFLALKGLITSLFLAYFLGAIIGLALIIVKKKSRHDYLPFGPFMALGGVIYIFFGPEIINWYLHLLTP